MPRPGGFGRSFRRAAHLWSIARSGAKVLRSSGLHRRLTPLVAAKLLCELPKRPKGALAPVHLHALADPLRPAIVDGEARLSYGEYEQRINRLTHGLAALGIAPGDRVAALLFNSHETLELGAALSALGCMSVQVGVRGKAAEVAYVL